MARAAHQPRLWRDLRRCRFLLVFGLTQVGLHSLILVLAAGFILVGPMLAAGLYETSRRLEKGEPMSLASTLRAGFSGGGSSPTWDFS